MRDEKYSRQFRRSEALKDRAVQALLKQAACESGWDNYMRRPSSYASRPNY